MPLEMHKIIFLVKKKYVCLPYPNIFRPLPETHLFFYLALFNTISTSYFQLIWERSDSVVECMTRDREAGGSSLTGVTVMLSLSEHVYPSLVLVQPRKTRPYITDRLLMGHKELNQTNKNFQLIQWYKIIVNTDS